MFKHTVEYTDFNDVQRKEELLFHLSLPEVTRLEAEIGKPIDEYAKELADNKDMVKLLAFLEKVLLSSYGKKTSDGKSFLKNKDLRNEFEYSQAYAEMFEQLLTTPDLARKFGAGVADNGQAKKNQIQPKVVSE